ncbi:hypothetical protein [Domibacillus mangrovi]|uniref:Phage portal protein n=1 Tax=Domibacillus mangrovi TaxID=1714354 RepID=A0A1Q5P426_9BACI|nr:hypothetical protein [Domibacillus mangrovi]OKL37004.1 hypothetical protein BLL40_05275 [Domibacillus mangrovi]
MTIKWKKFNGEVVKEWHGDIEYHRDLYKGDHAKLFSRAKELIEKGEITDRLIKGPVNAQNVKTPYITANISKLIAEIPATLAARSIGEIKSSLPADELQNEKVNEKTDNAIDGPKSGVNSKITHTQTELIEQITKNSKLDFEHWSNIVMNQVDGGIVGVPVKDEDGVRIDFKMRDVYFPHEDGKGADLGFIRKLGEDLDEYFHVYRERIEKGHLRVTNILYSIDDSDELEQVEDSLALELLGIEELETKYTGRSHLLIHYWANEKTMLNPLGRSCLENQGSKQDDINWTLTRNGITFERNGKPRIAVSKEVMERLEQLAYERYGDESKIDHRDLELTTFDEKGKALEVIQIDISQIGDIQWVKDLMKTMLMETRTSEKAVDFYLAEGSGGSQSGVAKFYDLFVSLTKAEQILKEYVAFLKGLYEGALWLLEDDDEAVIIEEPEITVLDMVPVSRFEMVEKNNAEYAAGTASLETTVRRNNPYASEDWIENEITRIEEAKQMDNSTSLLRGRQTLLNLNDNRDANGNIASDEE